MAYDQQLADALREIERLRAERDDMLEALKVIADWDKQPLAGEWAVALIEVIRSICERARAEIAKATLPPHK